MGDNTRPFLEVRQPPKNAGGGEHHVELTFEIFAQIVDVRLDEPSRDAQLRGEPSRLGDSRRREIHASYNRASSGPRKGVHAEVTLQVEKCLALHVTDFEALD